jgi:hypothetical protein
MLLEKKSPFKDTDGVMKQQFLYRVVATRPYLRLLLVDEDRTTASGDPVVWDLMMLSPDRYCWHRTDWPPGSCTQRNERCDSDGNRESAT